MRHVKKALNKLKESGNENTRFISIDNSEDKKGIAPIIKFTIQSDPISEVGINGCQAIDMLEFIKNLYESFNDSFFSRENVMTIIKIEEAIHWQEARTKDRIRRKVEGKNKI